MFNKVLVKHDQRHFWIELKSYLFINHNGLSNASMRVGLLPCLCPTEQNWQHASFAHDQQEIANGEESDDRRGQ